MIVQINDLIINEYYKNTWKFADRSHIYYFQFLFLKNNYIHVNHYYIKDGVYLEGYNLAYDKYEDIIEKIEFSEIISYLPSNHPDKLFFLRKEKIKKLLRL